MTDSEKFRKFRKRVLKLLLEKIETVLILRKQIFEDKSEKVTRQMSKEGELKFQVFDGKDYSIWKKRISLYLKWKKCDEPATRERAASTVLHTRLATKLNFSGGGRHSWRPNF